MSLINLYQDFGIPYWTEGKNVQKGWVNTTCPFCDDTSNHLGFGGKGFNCWKCGPHSTVETIQLLVGVSKNKALELIDRYRIFDNYTYLDKQKKANQLKLPSNLLSELPLAHKRYLKRRGFSPTQIVRIWHAKATGPASHLDGINFSNRLFIPIYWNGKMVSYQTRDITNKHKIRYITCPAQYSLINPKQILYGKQESWTDKIILVEGIFDVWKLGPRSAAILGLGYTTSQIRILSNFSKVFIVFDSDEPAQEMADRISSELRFRGVKTIIFNDLPVKDPAELSKEEARYLVRQLLD